VKSKTLYANNWEYLLDELRRLDLLIRLEILKQHQSGPQNPWEQLKGLVLSEGEIARLLAEDGGRGDNPADAQDAEIKRLTGALFKIQTQIQKQRCASLEAGIYLTLPYLAQLFQLDPVEEQCLIICLAPELDRKYEKLYAYLQDDVTCKKPSVDLVLKLLFTSVVDRLIGRRLFEDRSPLLQFRLLHLTPNSLNQQSMLLSRFIKLDDRIVNFLLGLPQMDAGLGKAARLVIPQFAVETSPLPESGLQEAGAGLDRRIYEFTSWSLNDARQIYPLFYLRGAYGSGQLQVVERVSCKLGINLIIADVKKMLAGETPFEDIAWLLGRESLLQPAALCYENFDALLQDEERSGRHVDLLLENLAIFPGLTFLIGCNPWKPRGSLPSHLFIDVELSIPGERERKELWERFRAGYRFEEDLDAGELSGKFRFTRGQIKDALAAAQTLARWRDPGDGRITRQDFHAACRNQAHHRLSDKARQISLRYGWKDIVLPTDARNQLREICSQVRHRHVVHGQWGFDRRHSLGGLNALFHGPPGTGKTMAAEIIAGETGLDLYKIDLSQVVSKYIGETEQNLHQIFQEAQSSHTILFFDEADALFGKRSEVKDAHDRYANVEIAYLLQKMEEYDGIVILATNFRQNMDDAFVRRLHFAVEFPFPDERYREKIWTGIWPENTPRSSDLDFSWLARTFRITGGNIRNIVVAAAFLAAEESCPVAMRHLVRATRRELQKMGKLCSKDDFGEYYEMLEQGV